MEIDRQHSEDIVVVLIVMMSLIGIFLGILLYLGSGNVAWGFMFLWSSIQLAIKLMLLASAYA